MENRSRESFAQEYVASLCGVLRNVPFFERARALAMLEQSYVRRCQVFLAGNGGSAATASHIANDLMKGIALQGKGGMRAIALT